MHYIITWHPRFALRSAPEHAGEFAVDVRRFGRLLAGTLRASPRLVTNPTDGDIARLRLEGRDGATIAVDIETGAGEGLPSYSGKSPVWCRLKTIGLGTAEWGLSLEYDPGNPRIRLVRYILADPQITKTGLNFWHFDDVVLRRYGFSTYNLIDCRDARRAISSTSRVGLGYQASLYDDAGPWKEGEDEDDTKGRALTTNLEDLKAYNAEDCVRTVRVLNGLRGEADWGTSRVKSLYDVQCGLARIAARMYQVGIRVDFEKQRELIAKLEQEAQEGERQFRELAGVPGPVGFGPNTLRAILYKRYEIQGLKTYALPEPTDRKAWSEKGSIKVDKNELNRVLADPCTPDEVRQIIHAYRAGKRPQTWKTTFLDGEKVREAIGPDGRIRPSPNTCGTVTGRWSYSNPNLQQVPQDLRAIYVADPGKVFVHFDKSALEVRVMRAISGDDTLGAHLEAADHYTEIAKVFFGLPAHITKDTIQPGHRKAAKAIHLGKQYRASPATIHQQIRALDGSIPLKATEALCAKWDKMYAGVTAYALAEQAFAMKNGYSATRICDRRRYYPRPPEPSETANYPIQGTAGDMMNLEGIALFDRLALEYPEAVLLIQLHDAFDVLCWEHEAEGVTKLMHEVMTPEYVINGRRWTFKSEAKIGKRWSDV